MTLPRNFTDPVKARAQPDPDVRGALRGYVMDPFISGEHDLGTALIRNYINATLGFDELGWAVTMNPKNLMRMFSTRGNPRLSSLSVVFRELERREDSRFLVEPERLGA